MQSDLDYKVVKGRVKPFRKPTWKPEPEKEKPVDAVPPKPREPGQPWVFPLPLDPTEVAAQVSSLRFTYSPDPVLSIPSLSPKPEINEGVLVPASPE